jgi:LemA protein
MLQTDKYQGTIDDLQFEKARVVMLTGFLGFFGVILVLLVVLAVYVAGVYNSLVGLRNVVKNAFAQIDVQLKRRYDLIPNLVEVAKKYMAHEKETLTAVIEARNGASSASSEAAANPIDPSSIAKLLGAEKLLGKSMGGFYAVSERYPELKADTQMQQLTEELTSTENKVAFARQAYNDAVMRYNTAQEKFPAVLFAAILGFKHSQSFVIEDETERDAVKVKFD